MYIIRKLSDNTKEYLDTYYTIIDEMEQNMQNVTISSNISNMFIEQILHSSKTAISLSENILKYTTNTQIEDIAKKVLSTENDFVENIKPVIIQCENIHNSDVDVNLYQRNYLSILNQTIKKLNDIQTSNNLDILYLNSMITQKQSQFDMIKNVLKC